MSGFDFGTRTTKSPRSAPTRPRWPCRSRRSSLAMLPAVLDQTILATALPVIAGDLGSVTDVSWVVTAYVVAAAATTPLWGKLGDRHGRKLMLEVSLTRCSSPPRRSARAAQDITQLIVLRLVQGAAAGGLMTLAMAVGRRPRRAARARPLPGLHRGDVRGRDRSSGRCSAALLVEGASWRWVFLVNLPLGARRAGRPRAAAAGARGRAARAAARRRSAPRCSPARPAP